MSDENSHVASESLPMIIVEPDSALGQAIARQVTDKTGVVPEVLSTGGDVVNWLSIRSETEFAAAVSLASSEAPLVMEALTASGTPVVLYGEKFDDPRRSDFSTLVIADTVLGAVDKLPEAVGNSLDRLVRNRNVLILVVDDSRSMRTALVRFLGTRCYRIAEAQDGQAALDMIDAVPGIKLVITDNEMPNVDGFTLTQEIRKLYSKDEMAVIGMSARTNAEVSINFINNGANDFLHKPFVKEELFCRVNHNVEMLERIGIIRELSHKDPLTKLYNRRYFFENAPGFISRMAREEKLVSVAMLDIDHFKSFNDTYGHDGGDAVLLALSSVLSRAFERDFILARFGGEEFCLLVGHDQSADILSVYEKLRRDVAATPVVLNGEVVSVTVSIGVCTTDGPLDEMVTAADNALYTAKETGRNKVVAR